MALGRAGERMARWDDVVGARGIGTTISMLARTPGEGADHGER